MFDSDEEATFTVLKSPAKSQVVHLLFFIIFILFVVKIVATFNLYIIVWFTCRTGNKL